MPDYEITGIEEIAGEVRLRVRYTGGSRCPHCEGEQLRLKDRFPGVLPRLRASEPFRRSVCQKHYDGISRSRLGQRERLSGATVERWFGDYLRRLAAERASPVCPPILGIDEHFFTRRLGYATTFCDLRNHSIYDVVAGRSEPALEAWLGKLEGKHLVKVVCMDLASGYRSLVRKHFPQARIVADRFHVIRIVNHHFLACWKELDAAAATPKWRFSSARPTASETSTITD